MVRLGTILTLGIIALGAAAFFGLGGASGIGQRIGGGFRVFGESIVSGITGSVTQPVEQAGQQVADTVSNIVNQTTQGVDDLTTQLKNLFNPTPEKPSFEKEDPLRTIPQIVPIFRKGALTITTGVQRSIIGGKTIEKVFASTLGRVAATPERVTLIGLSGRKAIVTPATAERLRLRGFVDL